MFFTGVIEGFYGRQWSWESRYNWADFLRSHDLSGYIYAPKGDAVLRAGWSGHWLADEERRLQKLRSHYKARDVSWGLGLSPLGLVESMSAGDRRELRAKVKRLNALEPDVLCILFDDMPGSSAKLADRQLALIDDIVNSSTAARHILCPTYYSFDPVLEQIFGAMPADYLSHLGCHVDRSIDVFWCGDKVIAPSVPVESLAQVTETLRRQPVLWDNYFANDGRVTADFLPIKPLSGREADLRDHLSGHILNPMNQPYVAQIVVAQLASLYRQEKRLGLPGDDARLMHEISSQLPAELAQALNHDRNIFLEGGLTAIKSRLDRYIDHYQQFEHPLAGEVVQWLTGYFAFDPECLTG